MRVGQMDTQLYTEKQRLASLEDRIAKDERFPGYPLLLQYETDDQAVEDEPVMNRHPRVLDIEVQTASVFAQRPPPSNFSHN